jgi:curli biogenesis system outer membrane secretion channel CsgG
MRLARLLSLSVLAPALALSASLAMAARPTLAVLPFTVDKQVVVIAPSAILAGTVESQTSLLTDELVHQLVATRKFDVLERQRVDDLIREKDFQSSDYASPDEAAKLAKILGADYFVLGRIDEMGAQVTSKSIPYSTQSVTQQEGHLKAYLRVIDARSGRIVAAEKFTQESVLRKPGKGDSIGSKLLADAATTMVSRIADTVFPLRIAQVDGATLYLNRGADSSGLKVGDQLVILSQGAAVVDQDTGESLGQTENEVGTASVTEVHARFVKALRNGDGSITPGMLVRKAAAAPAARPAVIDTPAGPRW